MKNFYWQMLCILLLIGSSGCIQSSRLAQHPLEGKTVAVVSEIPGAPFADFDMTIFDRVGQEAPVIDRNQQARDIPPIVLEKMENKDGAAERTSKVHELIDSVLVDFDMSSQIVSATLHRSASLIGFEGVEDQGDADYVLEVVVDDYGIGSDSWQSTAYFEVMGRIRLIDNKTGKKVWEGEVLDISPLTKALLSVGIPAGQMETPAALSKLSFEEMADVLNGLTAYASIQLAGPFREAYYRNHEREAARIENRIVVQHEAIPSFQHDR